MATIRSSLVLNDRMTSVLKRIQSAMDNTLDAFEAVQRASGKSFDDSKIRKARNEIDRAGTELEDMEQEYRQINSQQEQLNHRLQQGAVNAGGLLGKIKSVAGAYLGLQGAKWVQGSLDLFDTQNRAETQLGTVLQNMDAGAGAQDALMAKANELQGKTVYGNEALIGGAAEFATYMNDADAIGVMMDTLANYAAGMSGGEEVGYTEMVDYATGLGKIMTGSFDAMTKKGFEFTDAQKEIIENGTDMEKALVISDVVNESWQNLAVQMANTPSGKILQLKNVFGDMREELASRVYPAVMQLFDTIGKNTGRISSIVTGLAKPINFIVVLITDIIEAAAAVYDFFVNNWSWISPIIYTIVGALTAYAAISAIVTAVKAAQALSEGVTAAAMALATGSTFLATEAQYGLNAALLACPITWIVLAVLALIAVIAVVCSQIAKTTGVAQTGFGVFMGALFVAWEAIKNTGLLIANIGLGIWEVMKAVVSNIGTAFHNVIAGIKSWFYSLLSTVLSVVDGICAALNKIPFVTFDYSGITNAANTYAAKAAEAEGSKEEYKSLSAAFQDGYGTFDTFKSGWASDAFSKGAAWGDGVSAAISDKFSFDAFKAPDTSGFLGAGTDDAIDDLDDIADSSGKTAENTGKSSEELAYLRTIAEKEAINRFTTAEIVVDMSGMTNRIENETSIDGIISRLTDGLEAALVTAAEGAAY